MPAQHPPGCSCGDDDAHVILEGALDSLYSKIDVDNVVALNGEEGKPAKVVIRPWDERDQADEWLESDADDQLILQVPFTGSIKLRSIIVKSGPEGFTPQKMKIFANQTLDFDGASSTQVTQEFELAITSAATEYAVKPAKFPSVQSLTIFFDGAVSEETVKIFYIGFKGEYKPLTRDPIITVYEAQANPADHAKIRGLDQTAHSSIG